MSKRRLDSLENEDDNELWYEIQTRYTEQQLVEIREELEEKTREFEELAEAFEQKESESYEFKKQITLLGKNDVFSIFVDLPFEVQTAFQQYLLYFKNYVANFKGKAIYFEVERVKSGLRIDLKKGETREEELKSWFSEYTSFLNRQQPALPNYTTANDDLSLNDDLNLKVEELQNEIDSLGKRLMLITKRCSDLEVKEMMLITSNLNLSSRPNTGNTLRLETEKKIIKILFLSANPQNTDELLIEKEVKTIKNRLRLSNLREKIIFEPLLAVTFDDIRQAILSEEPEIIHFSGHGDEKGIWVEDEIGNLEILSTQTLSMLFELASKSVRCVILNSCLSVIQAKKIKKHIDYVIGMKAPVLDEASLIFSAGFYDAIGAGRDYDTAFKSAVTSLHHKRVEEWKKPILFNEID